METFKEPPGRMWRIRKNISYEKISSCKSRSLENLTLYFDYKLSRVVDCVLSPCPISSRSDSPWTPSNLLAFAQLNQGVKAGLRAVYCIPRRVVTMMGPQFAPVGARGTVWLCGSIRGRASHVARAAKREGKRKGEEPCR